MNIFSTPITLNRPNPIAQKTNKFKLINFSDRLNPKNRFNKKHANF